MRRREFITLVTGATIAPLAANAQKQTGVPVIGFFRSGDLPLLLPAFRKGLKEGGYTEGRNVAIEYHSAENRPERLPVLAKELSGKRLAMIVANGMAAIEMKKATSTIPLVFVTGTDPVRDGLVSSLNRPGGNATGVTFLAGTLGAKRLELLRQMVPGAETIGILAHTGSQESRAELEDMQTAARTIAQRLFVATVAHEREFDAAFDAFAKNNVRAVVIGSGAYLSINRRRLIALAQRFALPTSFSIRESAVEGGLMSYGTSQTDAYRLGGIYAARILDGARPADLPVMQGTKFELVINVKTAKALGIAIPTPLQVAADELIE